MSTHLRDRPRRSGSPSNPCGEEARHSLTVGDVFPVQEQQWKLDRIEDLYSPTGDWTVVLSRVE